MEGKVAIVTGAASGIGRATARLMVARGAKVVLADIDEVVGAASAAAIGASAAFLRHDVSEENSWRELIAFSRDRFGPLDVLVNNAGRPSPIPLDQVDAEEWLATFRVNALGPLLGCKHAVAAMGQRGGAIVNIASTASIVGMADMPIYASSKGAVNALNLSLAAYCAQQKLPIRCNVVHPGGTRTRMMRNVVLQTMGVDIDISSPEADAISHGVMDPILVAQAVVFLASDEASCIDGTGLIVDGMR